MKKQKVVYNPRPLDKVLFIRLAELKNALRLKDDSIIPYPECREKICRNFSINKQQMKEILSYLEYSGFIDCFRRGIKLNFILEDER